MGGLLVATIGPFAFRVARPTERQRRRPWLDVAPRASSLSLARPCHPSLQAAGSDRLTAAAASVTAFIRCTARRAASSIAAIIDPALAELRPAMSNAAVLIIVSVVESHEPTAPGVMNT